MGNNADSLVEAILEDIRMQENENIITPLIANHLLRFIQITIDKFEIYYDLKDHVLRRLKPIEPLLNSIGTAGEDLSDQIEAIKNLNPGEMYFSPNFRRVQRD